MSLSGAALTVVLVAVSYYLLYLVITKAVRDALAEDRRARLGGRRGEE